MTRQCGPGPSRTAMSSPPGLGGASEIEGFRGRAPSGGSRAGSCRLAPLCSCRGPGLVHAPLVSASAVTGPVSAPLLLSDTVALHLGPAPRQRDLLAPDRHICRDSSSKAGHAVAFQVEVNLGGATGTQCDVRPGNPSTTRACGLKHLRMGSAGPGGAASHGLRPSVRPAAPALRRTLSPACY